MKEVVHKGDYTVAKNPIAIFKYIQKEDKNPASYGCDPQEEIKARVDKQKILGKRILAGENIKNIVAEDDYAGIIPYHYKKIK